MPSVETFNTRLTDHLPRMRAYAIVLTRSEVEADILLEQTAHHARMACAHAPVDGHFAAWMHRILRNTYIQSLNATNHAILSRAQAQEAPFSEDSDCRNAVIIRKIIRTLCRRLSSHSWVESPNQSFFAKDRT